MKRLITAAALAAAAMVLALPPGPAAAQRPDVVRDSYVDRFQDDFILELCGIVTWTTLTERWSLTTYADGSQKLHTVRTFVPDDPRIPVEKGAATSFFGVDGSKTVVGAPLHLFGPDGGTTVVAAGRALLDSEGNFIEVKGQPLPSDAELAEYYCPR